MEGLGNSVSSIFFDIAVSLNSLLTLLVVLSISLYHDVSAIVAVLIIVTVIPVTSANTNFIFC